MQKRDNAIRLLIVSMLFLLLAACSNKEQEDQAERTLAEVQELAGHGQIPDERWFAGITKFQEVNESLGDPDRKDRAGDGTYAVYEDHDAAIGMTENNRVFDLRSSAPELQKITRAETEKIVGVPAEIRHVDEQDILVYELNEEFQMKFVFLSSDETATIDHLSVVHKPSAEIQKDVLGMSMEEKLGQLIIMGVEGAELDSAAKAFIAEQHVGGVILFKRNFIDIVQSVNLINEMKQANKSSKAPLLIGVDEEGGRVTRLPEELVKNPSNRQIGNLADGDVAFQIGELLGEKLDSFGINMDFAPVLDVDSNPKNPVIGDRSYGPDAQLAGEMGVQQIQGMKSKYVVPVIKHFPGHGDTSVDSHIDLPVIPHSAERLQKVELRPFKEAIESGADAVMVGHLIVNAYDRETPASFSKAVITELLREQLHFDGVVITDDLIMGAIENYYPIGDAAVKSIQAGGDILLIGHGYTPVKDVLASLKAAVSSGELPEKRINQSVERILTLKQIYELNDELHQEVDVDGLNEQIEELLMKMKVK
ncbi:beta-N-acetylhexosaminidase [Sporosarcina cascadiensis]|uniref:beta-N-acetylhexosaminidase n=1 Tax=Sporosarcina cascadiensis TaxID=2660747 RepID=UPI00129ACE8A|nr:beta-N-acetylhexosaminidase [Sporosarcina cascadiensis]